MHRSDTVTNPRQLLRIAAKLIGACLLFALVILVQDAVARDLDTENIPVLAGAGRGAAVLWASNEPKKPDSRWCQGQALMCLPSVQGSGRVGTAGYKGTA